MIGSRIEKTLARAIGLDAASVGARALEDAIRRGLRRTGCADFESYGQVIDRDTEELDHLIEDLVVGETWFFRDGVPFADLARWVERTWLPANSGKPFRMLSIPCSTGEEPYSMAMALLERGITAQRIEIDAVDVSRRALAAAERGVYGRTAVRGKPDAHAAFLHKTSSDYRIAPEVRQCVRFSRGNIVDPHFARGRGPYAAIFCRNLLIYLLPPARLRAFDTLHGLLLPGGRLYTGHAEVAEMLDTRFRRTENAAAFCYVRRTDAALKAPGPREPMHVPALKSVPSRGARPAAPERPSPRRARPARPAEKRPPDPTPALPSAENGSDLDRARDLADRGDLEGARTLCEKHLQNADPTPEAYALLGLIRRATGDLDDARECFRRSLYLDQDHYVALVNMALLEEAAGARSAAAGYRRRAERVSPAKGSRT